MAAVRTHERRGSLRQSFLRGAMITTIAALLAAAACAAVYGIASALGAMPDDVSVTGISGEGPLTLGAVIGSAALATAWAATVFGLFVLFSREPIKRFRVTALILFVLSLATPFTISGAPAGMIAALLAMHALVAAISVGALTVILPRK